MYDVRLRIQDAEAFLAVDIIVTGQAVRVVGADKSSAAVAGCVVRFIAVHAERKIRCSGVVVDTDSLAAVMTEDSLVFKAVMAEKLVVKLGQEFAGIRGVAYGTGFHGFLQEYKNSRSMVAPGS